MIASPVAICKLSGLHPFDCIAATLRANFDGHPQSGRAYLTRSRPG